MKKIQSMLVGAMALTAASLASAGTLVINSDQADPAPKKAFAEIIQKFEQENPDITIKYNLYDKEAYKTAIRNWLSTTPPDVVFWYAGNRMKAFVDRGLFEDVSDLWDNNGLKKDMASAAPAMTIDGKQWGMPYTYYQWGIYYRKDIFENLGLSEPKTWDEFLAVNAKLKANDVTPVTIGTKYLWTAAGWFDYLNMRTNGLAFHIDLMDGKIPYTDPRVRKTFENWKVLVDKGYFLKNHASYSWQEAQPFLYNGKAAMYLIGNFITPNFPKELDGKIGFFQFPQIDPSVGMAEDAPMDTIHIPSKAANKADARKFLEFMSRADNQTLVNAALIQIPPNVNAQAPDNYFLNKGVDMLNNASGTAQFYDRDTEPSMAQEGMKGFQEFMVKPERLDAILKRLERARKRAFR
ncbi:ABC transporter substrate-binding protein [Marinomonas aquiplantarum]|uniref:Carbohydrate ABC transporter substrate-binding protein (CUT1 family) n=1 Tax=Marinomonas aquiplantarum TaxID=491951 RepID=A0A366CYK9_9GAMM|nr:extracellular solute-binding protein [Marinomonas aquiplantarum]RBO82725.1 carbohydrate ABC transporter substrate-binding protein (CUT1 family) [Marinomonas aquiplantarum]